MQMIRYDIGHKPVENLKNTSVNPGKLSCFNFRDLRKFVA